MLHAGGSTTPLGADALADALTRRASLWVWLAGAVPAELAGLLAEGDGLELVAGGAGLPVIEGGDGLAVPAAAAAVSADGARVVAVARQLWRRGARVRLDGVAGRRLADAPATVQRGVHALARARERARRLVDLIRPPREAGEAALFAQPSKVDAYRNLAAAGLFSGESALADRWLGDCRALLDVGCGAGREALGFAARGMDVTAIDPCAPLVEVARALAATHSAGSRVELCVGALGELDLGAARFDAAFVSSDVYATIRGRARRVAALRALARAVKPGGVVLVAVSIEPAGGLARVVDLPRALGLGGAAVEPGDRWVAGAPEADAPRAFRHRFFSERELTEEIADGGLCVIERGAMWVLRVPAARAAQVGARRYGRRDDVRAEVVGDEIVVVQVTRGTAFRLNGTARTMFELAQQGLTTAEIAARVAGATGAPAARVLRDAAAALDELSREALLSRRGEPR